MRRIILFAVIILSACLAKAQWTQCPLYGGYISALAYNDSDLYAGTSRGNSCVYLSENYGSNWNAVNNGLPSGMNYGVGCIMIRGNEIYAGIGNSGIYKSTDKGQTWNILNNGLPSTSFSCCAIIIVDTNIFIATISCPGTVYMSSDSGNTWNDVSPTSTDTLVFCLAYDSTGIYAGTNGRGVYKTTDNGVSWVQMNTGLTYNPPPSRLDVFAMLANDNVIYICLNNYFIFKSTNHGATWTCCYGFYADVRSFAFVGSLVYGGTTTGICRTGDGQNWSAYNPGLPIKNITSLAAHGWDLFAGTSGGVFLLLNGSNVWTPVSNGISTLTFNSFTNIGHRLYAGSYSAGVFLTTDKGNTWDIKNSGLTDLYVPAMSVNSTKIFAGTCDGVFKSIDYGNNWVNVVNKNTLDYNVPNTIASIDTNVFVGYSLGVLKSVDNGTTWSASNNGLSSTDVRVLTFSENGNLFAAIYDIGVFMSTDNGNNWTNITNGAALSYINSLAVNDTGLIVGLGIYNPPAMTSNDYGANWLVGNNGLYGHNVNVLNTIGDRIIAGLTDGVFYTKNNGLDWYDISQGLPVATVSSIGRDDSCIYVGVSGNGIWKRPLSDFGIVISEINENKAFSNITIYPNPATDLVYINCKERSIVEIINMQGKVVSTKMLSGKNESIDVSILGSGVYMIKVKTANGVTTKKIIKQ